MCKMRSGMNTLLKDFFIPLVGAILTLFLVFCSCDTVREQILTMHGIVCMLTSMLGSIVLSVGVQVGLYYLLFGRKSIEEE